MKQKDSLRLLVDAAEQAPENGKLRAAIIQARRSLISNMPAPRDYSMLLANTGRALECIAEGMAWAGKMRASGMPVEKVAPVVAEQNQRAAALLRI